jgi:hypothetical protein
MRREVGYKRAFRIGPDRKEIDKAFSLDDRRTEVIAGPPRNTNVTRLESWCRYGSTSGAPNRATSRQNSSWA